MSAIPILLLSGGMWGTRWWMKLTRTEMRTMVGYSSDLLGRYRQKMVREGGG